MASIYTNTNINSFNRKQLRQAAVNVGVLTPASGNHGLNTTSASWNTAIKAK